ncbi:MAG: MBL fold metallo-hydrolase [Treponema sp.]|jgi:L-ascorbate metabolism protein UlaG (beta-lactamase superfamily)|nr:MBL fold metallo-hydrolase [Treponema sp.]
MAKYDSPVTRESQSPVSPVGIKIKWYGTATILLDNGGTKLLFDPFLPLNDKCFKPPMDELAAVENILVTHGHLDHIASIPAILKQGGGTATVYCTAKPREVLIAKGVDETRIRQITSGDRLNFGTFEVRVLKGKHIAFNICLVVKTFFNPRVLTWRNNLRYMQKENKICVEAGETVVYDIGAANKRILLLGSLNLDDDTEYPKGADLLILPFQGRSDLTKYAMPFIDRLQPKKVLLDHFDDAFPPISSNVKTGPFISLMRRKYPGVQVICTEPGAEWSD